MQKRVLSMSWWVVAQYSCHIFYKSFLFFFVCKVYVLTTITMVQDRPSVVKSDTNWHEKLSLSLSYTVTHTTILLGVHEIHILEPIIQSQKKKKKKKNLKGKIDETSFDWTPHLLVNLLHVFIILMISQNLW